MIIDTSTIIAVLRDEPEASSYACAVADAAVRQVRAVNFVESAVVPVREKQAQIAREAYRDFGKGSAHPARLNFGDCFAYALAKESREPLLFKGGDFSHTDVVPVLERKS